MRGSDDVALDQGTEKAAHMCKRAVACNRSAQLGDLLGQLANIAPGDFAHRATAPGLHGVIQGETRLPPMALAHLSAASFEVLLDMQLDGVGASVSFGLLGARFRALLALARVDPCCHCGTRFGRAYARCAQWRRRVFADRELGWPLGVWPPIPHQPRPRTARKDAEPQAGRAVDDLEICHPWPDRPDREIGQSPHHFDLAALPLTADR
jgi:hypothetical protein